jgi:hypothetical protein
MSSLPDGAKIITIAIVAHGSITKLDMPTDDQNLFDNVLLFSKAGRMQELITTPEVESNTLDPLYTRFTKDLTAGQTTFSILQQYKEDLNGVYTNLIKTKDALSFTGPTGIDINDICQIYYPVTYDKQFVIVPQTTFDKFTSCIIPYVQGIYVISIHEKMNEREVLCIFPNKDDDSNQIQDVNLLDPNKVNEFASALNNTNQTNKNIFTKNEEGARSIRMSELVKFIKDLAPNCYINLIDHSCSVINPRQVSVEEREIFAKYIEEVDVEKGFPQWGGKSKRKRKKNTKRKINKKRRRKLTKKI